MDVDKNIAFVIEILEDAQQDSSESTCNNTTKCSDLNKPDDNMNYSAEKHSAIWTADATLTLLKLYEDKLEMLETPKKKTRIWIAISESLKHYNIEMTPDQVRWKINALTKKYKQCIDSGQHEKFKYFKEMDNIYSQFNVDSDAYTIAELLQKKKEGYKNHLKTVNNHKMSLKPNNESRSMTELRKIRLANRIESDRCQSKIHLEKQWLEYLRRQEDHKLLRDEMFERNLKLKAQELELRKRALEMKESYELRKIQIWERQQEMLLNIEREKCDVLKKIFSPKN